jgi:hypothetical protein
MSIYRAGKIELPYFFAISGKAGAIMVVPIVINKV